MKNQLTIKEIQDFATEILLKFNCNKENAQAVAETIAFAERDGCHSHGLFRLPGYIAALKSGKVNGQALPELKKLSPAVIQVNGNNTFAPYPLQFGRDELVNCAQKNGIAALSLIKIHHFSALWIEIEALTERGLCAMAFTAYMPAVAPAGGTKPFYGTNPMAFGWPRKNKPPMIFDQATATKARGDVAIAARDNKKLPLGVGIDEHGNDTTDPNEILKGSLLPFGGYKGAAIALMIELLVGPLIGEYSSFEAKQHDNHDGGPPQGGELILAIDPTQFNQNADPFEHAERLFAALLEQEGTRLPGDRRAKHRRNEENQIVTVNPQLMETLNNL